jgi:signal peptidase I
MEKKNKKIFLWIVDLLVNLGVILILVVVIQKWIVAPFDVSGSSMCDTLNKVEGECQSGYGEKIIINEALYVFNDPVRGDIVVFKSPEHSDKYFIKRVIGLPGDIVEIRDGEIYINNEQIDEPYLNDTNRGNTKIYLSNFSVFEVPEDQYFMLGDNRKASTDSRSCFSSTLSITCKENPEKAFIQRDSIRGKAWLVWWPLSSFRTIESYDYGLSSESLAEK